MVSLTPCRRCHRRADCAIKQKHVDLLRGSAITKANVRCVIPEADFPPGTPVLVKAFEMQHDGYLDEGGEDYIKVKVERAGIVTGWKKKGKKATVVLDVGAEIRPASKNQDECIAHLHAEPDRLTRTGDPVDMCECGGLPKARCASRQFPYLRGGSDWTCPASLTGGGNG